MAHNPANSCRHVRSKTENAERVLSIDCRGQLGDGELLSVSPSAPTVEEHDTSDLTITNVAISVADVVINGQTVPAGQALQFKVAGGTAGANGTTYILECTAYTDSTPQQKLVFYIYLKVIS